MFSESIHTVVFMKCDPREGREGRREGRWEGREGHSENNQSQRNHDRRRDRGLIRLARQIFSAHHGANKTMHLSFDSGCVQAAELNPELIDKTLEVKIPSVGTAYLHLHVDHEEWDEFRFRFSLPLAYRAAERADPAQLVPAAHEDATGDSGAADTGSGGSVADTGGGDRARCRRAGVGDAAAEGGPAAADFSARRVGIVRS